jgi:hypothetical protein
MNSFKVVFPGSEHDVLKLPLPPPSLELLFSQIKEHFSSVLNGQNFILTDTQREFSSDDDLAHIKSGSTLAIAINGALAAPAPFREKISFIPHPKTMTMAGEFEYFAAQGRHPFVYAIAEFIDNSLRATRRNAPRPRSINISLMLSGTNPSTARGLIVIEDNGCGMTKQELNEWAVMNYSMEERGAAPTEPDVNLRTAAAAGAGRFLTGDLSFFGVGSKNAAFFMGSTVKVVTKNADSRFISELTLGANELEARYKTGQAVYEEDMIHRNPGDASTLSPMETPFSAATQAWMEAETDVNNSNSTSFTRVIIGDVKPDILKQMMGGERATTVCRELAHLYHYYLHGSEGNQGGSGASTSGSGSNKNININTVDGTANTVITTTKTTNGQQLKVLPNGEPLPEVKILHMVSDRLAWAHSLVDVNDDMETRILRTQKAELPFALDVPGKGTVSGVLYYFPFENDVETMPLDDNALWGSAATAATAAAPGMGGGGSPGKGNGGGNGSLTQINYTQVHGTAIPITASQQQGAAAGAGGGDVAMGSVSDDEFDSQQQGNHNAWSPAPIFQAFWQGRLIPGARIESIPFIEGVRTKRGAQGKDALPDEVFRRIKGSLFFGPAFRVTRNKLLFRDDLKELLAAAVPRDRNMEKTFRAWLSNCHATLDKSMRFENLAGNAVQAAVRRIMGENVTAFEKITDGHIRTFQVGDVVKCTAKPSIMGKILYFTVPLVTKDEGTHPAGKVHLAPLPAAVYGEKSVKTFMLRRLTGIVTDKELKEHTAKELQRIPSALRLEPMRFAAGRVLPFTAGDVIPETTASIMNGAGQRLIKAFFGGEKQSLVVTQKLWRLPEGTDISCLPGAQDYGVNNNEQQEVVALDVGEDEGGEQMEAARPAKRAKMDRRGGASKKAAAAVDENEDGNTTTPSSPSKQATKKGATTGNNNVTTINNTTTTNAPELILTVENKTSVKDSFCFQRISDGLKKIGSYALEYTVTPTIPNSKQQQQPLRMVVELAVSAGPPSSLLISGEGKSRLCGLGGDVSLGEVLPPFKVSFADEYDNPINVGGGTTMMMLMGGGNNNNGGGDDGTSPGSRDGKRKRHQGNERGVRNSKGRGSIGGGGQRGGKPPNVKITAMMPATAAESMDEDEEDDDGTIRASKTVIEELTVSYEQTFSEGVVVIRNLQIMGLSSSSSESSSVVNQGMPLFMKKEGIEEGSLPSAFVLGQKTASQVEKTAVPRALIALKFSLKQQGSSSTVGDGHDNDAGPGSSSRITGKVDSVALPVNLRPGAPRSVQLLPMGNDTEDDQAVNDGSVIAVQRNDELPEMHIQAIDAWGNKTGPCLPNLSVLVKAECPVLAPAVKSFDLNESGRVVMAGFTGAICTRISNNMDVNTANPPSSECATLTLTLEPNASTDNMKAALAAAQPLETKEIPIKVLPSGAPAAIQVFLNDAALPVVDELDEEDSPVTVTMMQGVEAGRSVGRLTVVLMDEAGLPIQPLGCDTDTHGDGSEEEGAAAAATGNEANHDDDDNSPAAKKRKEDLSGRLFVSWRGGSKKVVWTGKPFKLPVFEAPPQTNQPTNHWVRFINKSVTIEQAIRVIAVPGAPHAWAVSLADPTATQLENAGAAAAGSGGDDSGGVACGQPFNLEIEALDARGNRVSRGSNIGRKAGASSSSSVPTPVIALESEGLLEYDESSWQQEWTSEGVYIVRNICLSGQPGPIKITVSDQGEAENEEGKKKKDECDDADQTRRVINFQTTGAGGVGKLQQDTLTVELKAGRPVALGFEGQGNRIECGTKAMLAVLRVRAVDAAGNPTLLCGVDNYDVAINGSALATDGSGRSAAAAVQGGNKAKVKKGVAVFKNIKLTAEVAGSYALRVQSASRKVALADAVLHIIMAPQNTVTQLSVIVPAALDAGTTVAGDGGMVFVEAVTEDGRPLPYDIAAAGLSLKLTPPGASNRSGVQTITLLNDDDTEGEEGDGHKQEEEDEEQQHEDKYQTIVDGVGVARHVLSFPLAQLTAAGEYSAVAEYRETRAELLDRGNGCGAPSGTGNNNNNNGNKNASSSSSGASGVRSSTIKFLIQPGLACSLTVQTPHAVPDKVTVTNGPVKKQRLIARGAAVQLCDLYGNAVCLGGIPVRCALRYLNSNNNNNSSSGVENTLPVLLGDNDVLHNASCSSDGEAPRPLVRETGEDGRVYLGDLTIQEGSGSCSRGGGGGGEEEDGFANGADQQQQQHLELCLVCEAQGLYANPTLEMDTDEEGWMACWSRDILFSDDAARYEALQAAHKQREELEKRRQELEGRVRQAQSALSVATKQRQAAEKTLEKQREKTESAISAAPPNSIKTAEKKLNEARKKEAAAAADSEKQAKNEQAAKKDDDDDGDDDDNDAVVVRSARYGSPRHPLTGSIEKALRSMRDDPNFLGVLAQLATIDDEQLALVAGSQIRSGMSLLVVTDMQARQRTVDALMGGKGGGRRNGGGDNNNSGVPIPDFLVLSQALACPQHATSSSNKEPAGLKTACELAQQLTRAACCDGSTTTSVANNGGEGGSGGGLSSSTVDGALNIPFPHTRALSQLLKKNPTMDVGGLTDKDWPRGSLGFLVNLIRPVHRGHRATVLYPIIGTTMVFDTLDNAAAYRQTLVQRLKVSCGDIITLDGNRLSGRGVVSGSSFHVAACGDKAEYIFGTNAVVIGNGGGRRGGGGGSGKDGAAVAASAAARAMAAEAAKYASMLEDWLDALKQKESAVEAANQAEQQLQEIEGECQDELQYIQQQLRQLDGNSGGGRNSAQRRSKRGKHNNNCDGDGDAVFQVRMNNNKSK